MRYKIMWEDKKFKKHEKIVHSKEELYQALKYIVDTEFNIKIDRA